MQEQEYKQRWQKAVTGHHHSPIDLAVAGGAITTEPAFIFIAGYQAAIRATFREMTQPGWIAYAASEDRKPENPRPGVTINRQQLFGFKTWIAFSEQVDELIIKVGTGKIAQYVTLTGASEQLLLTSKQDLRFLKAMSQGIAEFRGADYVKLQDLARVKDFASNEPYYIYLALLSSLQTNYQAFSSSAAELISKIRQNAIDLPELDKQIQSLVNNMQEQGLVMGTNWSSDQKLFSMYSRGIQATLEKV